MDINEAFGCLHIGLPDDIERRRTYGDLDGAIRLIDRRLASLNLPEMQRGCLIAEREMMIRLPENYIYTREQAVDRVRARIPDFSCEEFDALVEDNRIDWIYLDGIPRYFDRFYESLVKTDRGFAKRAGEKNVLSDGGSTAAAGAEDPLDYIARKMRENGCISYRIRVRASVALHDDVFYPGISVLAHLPVPAACEQQSDIRIESVTGGGIVAPTDALQRTVCWQEKMAENHPFAVEYSYIHTARYHELSAADEKAAQPSFYTNEQPPHILFTPYIRELAANLTKGICDPLEKARAFYDFITKNVKYSFVRSYFCLEGIPETCARNLTGDCGMMALLFITLCRCAGIPARWQSGLHTRPGFCGAHDWAMFYIEPLGWLYADPSFGAGAVREGNESRRKFYFGNLDAFRMVANSEFQAGFTVPKNGWRADPYDNQVGEMEADGIGLRYFQFDRSKEVVSCEEL